MADRLMTVTAKASDRPGPRRERLTRQRVLDAALRFIDEHGAEELSMRRLATGLGVEAMALYRHVESKEDLFVGVIDVVVGEIKHPAEEALGWRDWLRETEIRRWETYTRHANVIPLIVRYGSQSRVQSEHLERVLRALDRAGFDGSTIHHMIHSLGSHLLGSAQILRYQPGAGALEQGIAGIPGIRTPTLRKYAKYFDRCDQEYEFERGLDLILSSFESTLVSIGPDGKPGGRSGNDARRSGSRRAPNGKRTRALPDVMR